MFGWDRVAVWSLPLIINLENVNFWDLRVFSKFWRRSWRLCQQIYTLPCYVYCCGSMGWFSRRDPVEFLKKKVKKGSGWLFQGYKFLEYFINLFCGQRSLCLYLELITLLMRNCGIYFQYRFYNRKGWGGQHMQSHSNGTWMISKHFLNICYYNNFG